MRKLKFTESLPTNAAEYAAVESSSFPQANNTQSSQKSWLQKFLGSKRTPSIEPAPDIIPSNDEYIKRFAADCKASRSDTFFSGSSSSSSGSSSVYEHDEKDSYVGNSSSNPKVGVSNEGNVHTDDDDDDDDAVVIKDTSSAVLFEEVKQPAKSEAPQILKISLSNLPYKLTEDELKRFGEKFGYKFVSIVFGTEKSSGLPSGSAVVLLEESSSLDAYKDCVDAIHAEDCGGRPVRAALIGDPSSSSGAGGNGNKRRLSGSGGTRYFLVGDISCKCNRCGKVGHKQNECRYDAEVAPCHLCAGKDHEAVNCPNITCFRCGTFGHHAKNCHNARQSSRPIVCTLCGSGSHDAKACVESVSSTYLSSRIREVVESTGVRCMVCDEIGHTMCALLPEVTDSRIFCPNCGEEGHHVDFAPITRKKSNKHSKNDKNGTITYVCKAPRMEAYTKFPELLSELEDPLHGGLNDRRDNDDFYRKLVRSQHHYDQALALFPSLRAPPSPVPARPRGHNNNNNSKNGNVNSNNNDKNENNNHRGGASSRTASTSFSGRSVTFSGSSANEASTDDSARSSRFLGKRTRDRDNTGEREHHGYYDEGVRHGNGDVRGYNERGRGCNGSHVGDSRREDITSSSRLTNTSSVPSAPWDYRARDNPTDNPRAPQSHLHNRNHNRQTHQPRPSQHPPSFPGHKGMSMEMASNYSVGPGVGDRGSQTHRTQHSRSQSQAPRPPPHYPRGSQGSSGQAGSSGQSGPHTILAEISSYTSASAGRLDRTHVNRSHNQGGSGASNLTRGHPSSLAVFARGPIQSIIEAGRGNHRSRGEARTAHMQQPTVAFKPPLNQPFSMGSDNGPRSMKRRR